MRRLNEILTFSTILLFITGCSVARNDIAMEQTTISEAPTLTKRFSTGYDLTYLAKEDTGSHILLWEHAVKDMDFSTPKHLSKTTASRRLHANKRYYEKQLGSGKLFLYHIVKNLKRRDMPLELAVIPIIESGFNPKAVSPNGARGIWQFMPGTAKRFSLNNSQGYDMRLDVIASTEAALDYFQKLYNIFGDWNLAIAAYNVGPGTVLKAVKKNKTAGRKTDLWNLNIPKSGIEYVERLYAFTDLIRQSEKYNITFPVIRYQPVFKKVRLRNRTLQEIANQTGTSLKLLKELNPGFASTNSRTTMVDYVLIPLSEYQADLKG